MPLFLMFLAICGMSVFHFGFDIPHTTVVVDKTIQGALDRAAIAGAQQYVADSLATGTPHIDVGVAEQVVRQRIADELDLDPVTLVPRRGSPLSSPPTVTIWTYNGPAFPFTFQPRADIRVTLHYPAVVVSLDGTLSLAAPIRASQRTIRVHRFAAAQWYPRNKP